MAASLASVVIALSLSAPTDDIKPFQGTWKVVAVFENGEGLSEQQIATNFVSNGKLTVDGPVISLLPPGQFENRQIAFTIDASKNPATIDLTGANKVGSRGIYMLSGDSLMICLPGPGDKDRPTDFSANKGSDRTLLILKREAASAAPAPEPEVKPVPVVPNAADETKKLLVGTWGHQDSDAIYYTTFNPDGTFSSSTTWKSGFRKVFNENVRSSGTWRLENGLIVTTKTASTDRNVIGQVYSLRITHLNDTSLIGIDDKGRTHSEWRVR